VALGHVQPFSQRPSFLLGCRSPLHHGQSNKCQVQAVKRPGWGHLTCALWILTTGNLGVASMSVHQSMDPPQREQPWSQAFHSLELLKSCFQSLVMFFSLMTS
jgi:hypothetical protein